MILSKQNRTITRGLKVLSRHLSLELMPLWYISELLSCHILLFFYSSLRECAFSCIKTVDDPSLLNNKWSCPSWCNARGWTITTQLAKYWYHQKGSAFSHEESFLRITESSLIGTTPPVGPSSSLINVLSSLWGAFITWLCVDASEASSHGRIEVLKGQKLQAAGDWKNLLLSNEIWHACVLRRNVWWYL